MDYHQDRFSDCSLGFIDAHDRLSAVFPANFDQSTQTVWSHQGLTYGGLLTLPSVRYDAIENIFSLLIDYYKQAGAARIVYKRIPYIYNVYPSDEDLYIFSRLKAQLYTRAISSAIDLRCPLPMSARRIRGYKKAKRAGFIVKTASGDISQTLPFFWDVLTETLVTRHHTRPVHTLSEMQLLISRHPQHIKLVTVEDVNGQVVGGTLLFVTARVIHAQYIAANEYGRKNGALDLLFTELVPQSHDEACYFDFGISTEQGGTILNEGLITQKQEFGGRAVCYDSYIIPL